VFYRQQFATAINSAVFPGVQGGPHMNAIAAIATALREVNSDEFRDYARRVVENSQALATALSARGYRLQTGGTDTHLILWDLRPNQITGSKMELILELAKYVVCCYLLQIVQSMTDRCQCMYSISTNKNAVQGDTKMLTPGGLRIGTAPLTTRGLQLEQCEPLAEFLHRGVQIGLRIHGATANLAEFRAAAKDDAELATLRQDVEQFALALPMPGYPPLQ
jgi:glycine hydroxymethyltransferase